MLNLYDIFCTSNLDNNVLGKELVDTECVN